MRCHKHGLMAFLLVASGLFLLGMLVLLVITSPVACADAGSLFVKPDGTGAACSQTRPCPLQTALSQAEDGDVIYLAQGTYTGTGSQVISITRSITLYGGWDGAPAGPVVRDPILYPTTLDGEGQRRVVYVGRGITVTIEDLTLTNGVVTDEGAGLYARDAYLTLRYTTIYSNVADSLTDANTFGGGACVRGGALHVISSAFQNNASWCNGCPQPGGGGLYIYGTLTTTVENCLFEANDSWLGSGLMFDGGNNRPILIRYTTFQENGWGLGPRGRQGWYAGGASLSQADAVVEDSAFLHNQAAATAGALQVAGLALSMSRNLVSNNVSNNTAGIAVWNSVFTLTNNIIVDNQPGSSSGRGVYITSRSIGVLQHNTIARNTGRGGGYGILLQSGQPITLVNTILVSHTVGISVTAGSTATLEGTLWGGGAWANRTDWAGNGMIITGVVNLWGEPGFVDPFAGDYHIGPGSAAIDSGVHTDVRDDIDSEPRPMGRRCDIGADERPVYICLPVLLKARRR